MRRSAMIALHLLHWPAVPFSNVVQGLGRRTMLVTELACRDMEAGVRGPAARLGRLIRRILRRAVSKEVAPSSPGLELHPHPRVVNATDPDQTAARPRVPEAALAFRWRRHPQLLSQSTVSVDAEDHERSARSAAVRGLFLARSGRFDDARTAFAVAAEASIDLTATPGFWDLPRSGMLAAAAAYEDVERFREAAALSARVRLRYRPRSMPAMPAGRRRTASGS